MENFNFLSDPILINMELNRYCIAFVLDSFLFVVSLHLLYFIIRNLKNIEKHRKVNMIISDVINKKINETCSICLDFIQSETKLLCGHSFCGYCILEYKLKQRRKKIICPNCRSKSPVLIITFNAENNPELFSRLTEANNHMKEFESKILLFKLINYLLRCCDGSSTIQIKAVLICFSIFWVLVLMGLRMLGRKDLAEIAIEILYLTYFDK